MNKRICPKCHRFQDIVSTIINECPCGFVFPPEKREDIFDEVLNRTNFTKEQVNIYKMRYNVAK